MAIRILGHTRAGMIEAMTSLQELYGSEHFSQVSKTMTADNAPEFAQLSLVHIVPENALRMSVTMVY